MSSSTHRDFVALLAWALTVRCTLGAFPSLTIASAICSSSNVVTLSPPAPVGTSLLLGLATIDVPLQPVAVIDNAGNHYTLIAGNSGEALLCTRLHFCRQHRRCGQQLPRRLVLRIGATCKCLGLNVNASQCSLPSNTPLFFAISIWIHVLRFRMPGFPMTLCAVINSQLRRIHRYTQ
jgi:hypothetical protein